MSTYKISKSFRWRGKLTDKVMQVCRMFGLTADRLTQRRIINNCRLEINDGDIVYITGPSGAGKSVLLKELEKAIPTSERVNLARIKLPRDKTLIDCIDADLLTSLRMLSDAGLNDVFCILNQPANLSEGQKYRFRLAMAMAAKKKFIFADEFCSELDRITAVVISYNIHKFAKRTGTTFILASSHEDLMLDLAPDVLVIKELSEKAQVIYKNKKF
ncbi:MAG: ATP-binding cassette domain-containing protein [Phycisphaerae bacterium]|nr:ATP-binding cassette domain-containing protein [Phycisphaerae bacterium]NIP55352.1 ATP-binding cassette domain-containing protein [Phycisphaerae bacterium]NIS54121.1 ATP-binding cassette domain-containing protein [Phycisphaerae bacterium]NIU11673.1 ATP-binding cassette domain-containing protein [Phycisphaerae bacterium]NIU59495.1 ATP-binding cassette domain-containing protein [Phycisphaerae bacterium]